MSIDTKQTYFPEVFLWYAEEIIFFFFSFLKIASHFYLTWGKKKVWRESCSFQAEPRQSNEIISMSIFYSQPLSHHPEIEGLSVKWQPTNSHREEQIRVATHRQGVTVMACIQRPFSKLVLKNKLIWTTPQLAKTQPQKQMDNTSNAMNARLLEEL